MFVRFPRLTGIVPVNELCDILMAYSLVSEPIACDMLPTRLL
jgi:hypothetical protein